MKPFLFSLLLLASGLAAAMTPAEFTALYEKPNKTAADCYKLFEAYRDGDGTEKNDSRARKWVLAAHAAGMTSARRDISSLPWRTGGKYKGKPSLTIAEVDDETAHSLGKELVTLLEEYYTFIGGGGITNKPADKATMQKARRLIADGADLNVWVDGGQHGTLSALYLACNNCDFKLAQLLIDHGADPSANSNRAITVSFEGTSGTDTDRYKKEIQEGMERAGIERGDSTKIPRKEIRKMEARERKSAKTRRANHLRVFSFLMSNGADIHMHTTDGWSLMYLALRRHSALGITLLAKAGLDPNTRQNPHEHVPAGGLPSSVKYMYDTGHVAGRGYPIHFAAENVFVLETEALLKAGADPNLKDEKGQTALDITLENIEELLPEVDTKSTAPLYLHKNKDIAAAIRKAGGKASEKK